MALTGAAVCVLLLRGCAFTSCLIPSTGMENSIFQGERILVNKWSYGLRLPMMSFLSYHRWGERPVKRQDIVVFNNPARIQQPVIDRREVYISRCIGVPGDTLLVDSLFFASSAETGFNPDKKRLYAYPAEKEMTVDSLIQALAIADDGLMGSNDSTHVRSFSRYEYYLLEQALPAPSWIQPLSPSTQRPLQPLVVPGKGSAIEVHPWNITLLRNTLVMHEGRQAEIKNDTLYVDGQPVTKGYFTKDYYWMGANNTINLSDSRLFGFVPQDHIIGKAWLIWFSKEKGSDCLEGYRWNRFFQRVK
jgi:signal peptidase I